MSTLKTVVKSLAAAAILGSTLGVGTSAWALLAAPGAATTPSGPAAAPTAASGATAGLQAPNVVVPSPFVGSASSNAEPEMKDSLDDSMKTAAKLNGEIQVITLQVKKKKLLQELNQRPAASAQAPGVPGSNGASSGDSTLGGAQAVLRQLEAQKAQQAAQQAAMMQAQLAAQRQMQLARERSVRVLQIYGMGDKYYADLMVGGDSRFTATTGSKLPAGQTVSGVSLNGVQVEAPAAWHQTPRVQTLGVDENSTVSFPTQTVVTRPLANASSTPHSPVESTFPPMITGPGVPSPVMIPENLRVNQ